MEYNQILMVANTILFIGAGIAFLAPLRKRERWWLWLPVGAVLSYLSMELGYHAQGPIIAAYYLATYLIIALVTNRAAQLNPIDSCYCAVWIFISAIAVRELWLALRLSRAASLTLDLRSGAELILFAGVLFLVLWRTAARRMPLGDVYQVGIWQLVGSWLVGGMFTSLSHVFLMPNLEHSGARVVIALCQLCCLLLLAIQLELYRRRVAEKKLDVLNLLCDFGAQQYAVGQKNMEILDRKCEELEEKIRQMEQYLPEELRTEAKQVIREAQLATDSMVKTGNEVLDIVLTEKKLLAETKQAQINCVADGKLLNFMETMDIYALFAYGMDTALEDVERIADESHRFIDVLIHEAQNFVVINTSHPLPQSVVLKNRNALNNYKVLVVQRIVEKYHGMISLDRTEGYFTLKILLPLSQNRK